MQVTLILAEQIAMQHQLDATAARLHLLHQHQLLLQLLKQLLTHTHT